MNIRGAIFDLDGTLTDSMYIWQKAPVDLVRRYGGDPPEDLARDLKEMGRREAAEYLRSRFSLSATPEELMDTLNDLVTEEYRSRVPMKPGADRLLARLADSGISCCAGTVAALPLRRQLCPVRRQDPAGHLSGGRPAAGHGPGGDRGVRGCPPRRPDRPRGGLPGLRRLGRLCRRGPGGDPGPCGLVRPGPGGLGAVKDGDQRPFGRFRRRIGGTTFRRLIKLQCKEASGKEASI